MLKITDLFIPYNTKYPFQNWPGAQDWTKGLTRWSHVNIKVTTAMVTINGDNSILITRLQYRVRY